MVNDAWCLYIENNIDNESYESTAERNWAVILSVSESNVDVYSAYAPLLLDLHSKQWYKPII